MTILSLLIWFNWKAVNAKGKSLHLMEQLICFFSQFNCTESQFYDKVYYENSVQKKPIEIFRLSIVNSFILIIFLLTKCCMRSYGIEGTDAAYWK